MVGQEIPCPTINLTDMAIYHNRKKIDLVYYGKKAIAYIYKGSRLIYEAFSGWLSCFACGYWRDEQPWTDDLPWQDDQTL